MHLKRLLTLSLITLSLLSLAACGRKEVVSVDIPNTSETVVETVKPAEPIVVSVEPINEAKEETEEDLLADTVFPADTTVDYYGKDVENQPKSTSPNTGLAVADEDSSTTSDVPQDSLSPAFFEAFGDVELDTTPIYRSDGSIFGNH